MANANQIRNLTAALGGMATACFQLTWRGGLSDSVKRSARASALAIAKTIRDILGRDPQPADGAKVEEVTAEAVALIPEIEAANRDAAASTAIEKAQLVRKRADQSVP